MSQQIADEDGSAYEISQWGGKAMFAILLRYCMLRIVKDDNILSFFATKQVQAPGFKGIRNQYQNRDKSSHQYKQVSS